MLYGLRIQSRSTALPVPWNPSSPACQARGRPFSTMFRPTLRAMCARFLVSARSTACCFGSLLFKCLVVPGQFLFLYWSGALAGTAKCLAVCTCEETCVYTRFRAAYGLFLSHHLLEPTIGEGCGKSSIRIGVSAAPPACSPRR